MNSKEVALFFGMVAVIMISMMLAPVAVSSDTVASSFVPDKNTETFYIGKTSECNVWQCYTVDKDNAVCKCKE